jgi:hypothetical protein
MGMDSMDRLLKKAHRIQPGKKDVLFERLLPVIVTRGQLQ